MKQWLAWTGLVALVACTSPSASFPQFNAAEAPNMAVYRLDLGSKSQAQIGLRLRIPSSTGFNTQASLDGSPEKKISDIVAFSVFLVDTSGVPSGTLTPLNNNTYTIPVNALSSPSDNQLVVFDNVPASTNQFFACAAAFDDANPTLASNITQPGTTDYGKGDVICSSSGGDGSGSVTVNASYQLSSLTALQINLDLLQAKGATLDVKVTVNDG